MTFDKTHVWRAHIIRVLERPRSAGILVEYIAVARILVAVTRSIKQLEEIRRPK